VTYTYNVPRVVCYRVPLDACGNPIVGYSTETAPAKPQTPTPAKKRNAADEKPGLGPDAAAPRPIEDEDKPPMKEGPMKDRPSMKQPAREESIYGGKRT
jgi:hypothetical protein